MQGFEPRIPKEEEIEYVKTGWIPIATSPNPRQRTILSFNYGWRVGKILHDVLFNGQDLVTDEREQEAIRLHSLSNEIIEPEVEIYETIPTPLIRPVPKVLFPDPKNPPTAKINQLEVPTLPEPEYPEPEPNTGGKLSNTEREYAVQVVESFNNHKFGCLICTPFTHQQFEFMTPKLPAQGDFLNELKKETNDEYAEYEKLLAETPALKNSENEAVYTCYLPHTQRPAFFRGAKAVDELALYYHARAKYIDNYPIVGILSTKEPKEIPYDVPMMETQGIYYLLGGERQVAVPLDLYDGHKLDTKKSDQLSIIWKSVDPDVKKQKQITLPSPIDVEEITVELLQDTLPKKRYFGRNLSFMFYEDSAIDNISIKTTKAGIFHNYKDRTELDKFIEEDLKKWLKAFCKESVNIKDSDLCIDAADVFEGDFFPYRADYLGWDEERKSYHLKGRFRIYNTNPNI